MLFLRVVSFSADNCSRSYPQDEVGIEESTTTTAPTKAPEEPPPEGYTSTSITPAEGVHSATAPDPVSDSEAPTMEEEEGRTLDHMSGTTPAPDGSSVLQDSDPCTADPPLDGSTDSQRDQHMDSETENHPNTGQDAEETNPEPPGQQKMDESAQ